MSALTQAYGEKENKENAKKGQAADSLRSILICRSTPNFCIKIDIFEKKTEG